MSKEKTSNEVSFVTKRALLVTSSPIAIPLGQTVVHSNILIIEYTEDKERYHDIPSTFRVLGFGDGRKLTKSYIVHLGVMSGSSLTELTEDDDLG